MLQCADCRARVAVDAERCPHCGGRLLGPPDLLARRWVIVAITAAALALGIAWGLTGLLQALTFWRIPPQRVAQVLGFAAPPPGSAEHRQQLVETLRDAERAVAPFPMAVRLGELRGENPLGTAPVPHVCWEAPVPYQEVVAYHRRALPSAGWRLRREDQDAGRLGVQRKRVRLVVLPPEDRDARAPECPPATTYILSFALR